MFEELREKARQHIIEELADFSGYFCDFHDHAFNEDYYECYNSEAVKQLEEMGVFDCIEYVKNYEQDNFGVVNTDFSNPCDVLNMMWYIIGEEELIEFMDGVPEADEFWNEEIEEKECNILIAKFKEKLDE